MMWKDEGYMASGEKMVSPSLNAFSHASEVFSVGALFSKWHVYDISFLDVKVFIAGAHSRSSSYLILFDFLSLCREVLKKDQEVVEWQLKEKETKAQLQEVDEKLKRERHAQMSQPLEPKKLLTLLPALREWLRSLKKVPCNVDSLTLIDVCHE